MPRSGKRKRKSVRVDGNGMPLGLKRQRERQRAECAGAALESMFRSYIDRFYGRTFTDEEFDECFEVFHETGL